MNLKQKSIKNRKSLRFMIPTCRTWPQSGHKRRPEHIAWRSTASPASCLTGFSEGWGQRVRS